MSWLIVADDVTGALDGAVGFAGTGIVEYGRRVLHGVGVAAVSTGSRARPTPPSAPEWLTEVTTFDRLFVKIDSTLRGWPREHVQTTLDSWHAGATAVICPAAPALGRTVRDGQLFVDGGPARHSAAGVDPVAPIREDRLTEIFAAPLVTRAELPSFLGILPAVVVDADSDDELAEIARLVDSAGPLAVPVGSFGLASALGALRPRRVEAPPTGERVVVVVTSAHPVARLQVAALGSDVPVVVPPAAVTTPIGHDDASAMARSTALRAVTAIQQHRASMVVVVGGDGTDALLDALDASGVEVLGALLPGVPWGRIRGGSAEGLLISTKSGGFGHAGTLTDIIRSLTQEHS